MWRRKGLWAWVVRHLSDKATQDILSRAPYFQDHLASIAYLDCQRASHDDIQRIVPARARASARAAAHKMVTVEMPLR